MMPSDKLAGKINKIINKNKNKLKQFQNKYGEMNLNLLIGSVLGGVCCFSEKPMIDQILNIFISAFNDKQLDDYANFMTALNNYFVDALNSNGDIYLFEDDKWTSIKDADFNSVYALWYAFFGIIKIEFTQAKSIINKLKDYPITTVCLECYENMAIVMTSKLLDTNAIKIMHNNFPKYARKFNELRKLMYMQNSIPHASIIH